MSWDAMLQWEASQPTAHIIQNEEIGLTVCGRLLPYRAVSDPTPWELSDGDVAHWDDDTYPEGFIICGPCNSLYAGLPDPRIGCQETPDSQMRVAYEVSQ